MQCHAKRDYNTFWPPFFQGWFAKFPECPLVFPDMPVNVELSIDQKEILGAAVKVRQDAGVLLDDGGVAEPKGLQQLRNKLHNMWGASRKARQAKEMDSKTSALLIAELMQSQDMRT
jgi:hypothetical protein